MRVRRETQRRSGEYAGSGLARTPSVDLRDFTRPGLCVPITSSMSCDQVIFVDHAIDVSLFSDAVQVEVDRLG